MLSMSFLKAGIVIIVVLCCNLQVRSDPERILVKFYDFNKNQELIIGKNHVDNSTLVYALCSKANNKRTAACTIFLHSDGFDDRPAKTCPVFLSTKLLNGNLDFIGIDVWAKDKAVFTWKDVDGNNPLGPAQVKVQIVRIQDCRSIMHEVEVENGLDAKPQIHHIYYKDSFVISYLGRNYCENYFCKMIVNQNDEASEPERWFFFNEIVHAIEPVDGHPSILRVAIGNGELPVQYHVLNETGERRVAQSGVVYGIGWSTSNGLVAVCTNLKCVYSDHNGEDSKDEIALNFLNRIEYGALYNLPDGGHLAVICETNRRRYWFIRMAYNGRLQYSHDLGLKCYSSYYINVPKVTIKFFKTSITEYCLSLFHPERDSYMFRIYCFSVEELPVQYIFRF